MCLLLSFQGSVFAQENFVVPEIVSVELNPINGYISAGDKVQIKVVTSPDVQEASVILQSSSGQHRRHVELQYSETEASFLGEYT